MSQWLEPRRQMRLFDWTCSACGLTGVAVALNDDHDPGERVYLSHKAIQPRQLARRCQHPSLTWKVRDAKNYRQKKGEPMTDEKRPDRPDNDLVRPERAKPEELRDWETVQQNENDETHRLRIAGGWLYRTVVGATDSVAMVYVADTDG